MFDLRTRASAKLVNQYLLALVNRCFSGLVALCSLALGHAVAGAELALSERRGPPAMRTSGRFWRHEGLSFGAAAPRADPTLHVVHRERLLAKWNPRAVSRSIVVASKTT
ncbi:MAG: hypothetical protein ABSH04_06945 [Acidimicrobiales bacterium]